MSERKAVHWLRSRQERNELDYWFSLVSYNRRDISFSNRIYFIYLILFFSVWIFVTLSFLASGGSILLLTLDPSDPSRSALLLEVLFLSAWGIFVFWQALKRSPVVFFQTGSAPAVPDACKTLAGCVTLAGFALAEKRRPLLAGSHYIGFLAG